METATAFVISHEPDPNRKTKGTNLIALALTRSIGRKGVKVVRVHPNLLDYSLDSKYCSKVELSPNLYESESDLVDFLSRLAGAYEGKKVLIPASDDCAKFLGKYQEELSAAFAIPVSKGQVIDRIINKQEQYEDAEKLGIPIPETYFPADLSDVQALAKEIGNYPYVIKPLVAHKWRLAKMQKTSKGRKAVVINTADDLLREYEQISQGDTQIMVQEVVPGGGGGLYTFLSYFDEKSEPLAYCVRRKIRQKPIDFGYCTSTVSCHDDTVVEQSIRLLQGIGYHGISGVEYKHDSRTGQYKLIEINARAVQTTGIAEACGVDLPYIAFQDKAGRQVEHVTTWRDGVLWIWLGLDFTAAWQLRKAGRLTLGDWLRSVRGERTHAIFAPDDAVPAIGFYRVSILSAFRKWLAARTA